MHYVSSSDSEDQQRVVEAEPYIQSLTWLSKRRLLLKSFASSLKTFSGKKRIFQRALLTTSFLVNMEGEYAWDRKVERVWKGSLKGDGNS